MQLLDGKTLSTQILEDLKSKISSLIFKPRLDIIIVGSDPASLKYVEMKQKKAESVGVTGLVHQLPENVSSQELIDLIDKLNQDPQVTAFMVQLPLPNHLKTSEIVNHIDPSKDADGLTVVNLGKLFQSDSCAIPPATAVGIINLLNSYQIQISGKHVIIINDSPIVGLPLMALFDHLHATVTVCHKYTENLGDVTKNADILVSATGVKNLINSHMVKNGAVVVDVAGGDVDFDNVKDKCSFITPTFGGVGPMTVASLLQNTYNIFINNGQKFRNQ